MLYRRRNDAESINNHLARGDGNTNAEPEIGVTFVDADDRLLSAERPSGIVFVGNGSTEHGEHTIADQLLDAAAMPFDVFAHLAMEEGQAGAHVLGVGSLGVLGGSDDVGEQHTHDLAGFLAVARCLRLQCRATLEQPDA